MTSNESDKDDNCNIVEIKDSSAYLWRGFCGKLEITSYELFNKIIITDIALGARHSLFLAKDASVFVSGENAQGQLGLGTLDNRMAKEPIKVESLPGSAVQIACGRFHNALVMETGEVFCWGSSSDGQCGTGALDIVTSPSKVPIEISSGFCRHGVLRPSTVVAVKSVACGNSHTLALSNEGEVWSWGAGPQLGLGELKHALIPRRVDSLCGQVTIAICCGERHSMALVLRQSSPRSSPVKLTGVKSEVKSVLENKLYPSRCSACNKEIYTYTDTTDMCIIDTLHCCTVNDKITNIDSTIVEEVSTSSSSSEAQKQSITPSPEREQVADILEHNKYDLILSDSLSLDHTESQLCSDKLYPKGKNEETSFLEISAMDMSVLVVPDENPFEELAEESSELSPVPEAYSNESKEHTKTSTLSNQNANDRKVLENSDEDIWKRRLDTDDDGDEEVKYLYNKQQVKSLSTTSVKSLSILKQSEAMEYLQRQLQTEKSSSPNHTPGPTNPVASTEDASHTFVGNVFGMMAQVRSMTSKAFTDIQTFSVFGSNSSPLEAAMEGTDTLDIKSDIELSNIPASSKQELKSQSNNNTCDDQQDDVKDNFDRRPIAGVKKSGTFIEWTREMASVDDDPSSLTHDQIRKSIRTIEMQQKNLQRASSSMEIIPPPKIVTSTDVWVWGSNGHCQLGLGDQLDRSEPVVVKFFAGRHVIKLAAGESHSLAMTANSQVFSWGSNSYGQIGQPEYVHSPTRVKMAKGFTTWDIAAGQSHSIFLGDNFNAGTKDGKNNAQPCVFYCGKHPSLDQQSSMAKTHVPLPLNDINKLGWIIQIRAGGSHCACKVLNPLLPISSPIFELAASERAFYCQMIKTTNLLLRPLQKSPFYSAMDVYPYKSSLQNVMTSFFNLTKKIGEGITDLTQCIQSNKPIGHSLILAGHAQVMEAFRQYSNRFSDLLAVGGFDFCTKAGSEFFEKIQNENKDLSEEPEKNIGAGNFLMKAMRYPFFRLAEYSKYFQRIAALSEKQETEDQIQAVILNWEALKVNITSEHKLSEVTRVFWETSSPKIMDTLKTPSRRLIRESKTHPLLWPAGGRFANHLFVLFNDGFLHAQSTGQILLPLETLWVESGGAEADNPNTITATSPEERFELQVATPSEKAEWLIAFNSAISKALTTHKPMSNRNSGGERFTPPLVRSASHKFVKPGIYKDAIYDGSWISGKVHGSGVIKWPDGSYYEGDFKKGLIHGFGVYTIVRGSNKEIQKGNWKDGKLNGKGSISYANGDYYEGFFQNGQKFGHGMLQTGRHKSNCSSVYIGEWLNNLKEGYGVQDDILKGEKYMGLWVEGYRHGSGLLVTLDGMYFEGNFYQNKLMGFGVMISDDDTLYEGDFVGTTHLSGKGILTLPYGDRLEGHFSGSLNEGVKINGTFIKSSASSEGDRKTLNSAGTKSQHFGRLCVTADKKWEEIFSYTWSSLGQTVLGTTKPRIHTEKAWELVAVMVSSGRKILKNMSGVSPSKLIVQQNTLEELAKIPAHRADKLSQETVQEISAYLTKAFDTIYHPLGQLMDTLVDVFRASYIGIGAHPRLLHHALQEVMSFVRRLYQVVRILFPALPANGGPVHVHSKFQFPHTTEEAQEFIEGLEYEDPNIIVLTAAGLIFPILLPKIYPPLFDLYALYNESNDDRYWERVTKLNHQSDMGLMAYLGIEQRFWLMDEILKQDTTQKLSIIKDVCYAEAVDVLQQLSTAFSPLEKLKIIEQSFNEITKTVSQSLKDDHMWCMDDLFPIFQFVVVRAKIHHLGAEIQIIEDLMEPHLEHGEFGMMFTTLKACYFQVQNEKLPHH